MPAVIRSLRNNWSTIGQECLGVVQQCPALDQLAVVGHLHFLTQSHCQIPDTALDETAHASGDLRHTKPRKVRLPPNRHAQDIGLLLRSCHGWLADFGHVVLERLLIQQLPRLVMNDDLHLLRKDVDELHAIAVLTTDQLLLVLVVVGRSQQLAEDHLRNPHLVLRVLRDIDRLAVILNREAMGLAQHIDLLDLVNHSPGWDRRHLLPQTDRMIVSVDQELIDQLVEAGIDCDGIRLKLRSPRGVV